MKKNAKYFAAIAALAFNPFQSQANELMLNDSITLPTSIQAKLQQRSANEFMLSVIKPKATDLKVFLIDQNGVVVHRGNIESGTHIRLTHDLSKLSDGEYTYQIHRGNQVVFEQKITKGDIEPVFEVAEVQANIQSYGDNFAIVHVRKPADEVVKIKLSAPDGRLLHVKRLGRGETHFRIGFDLASYGLSSCNIEVFHEGASIQTADMAMQPANR